jgi:hypothetical protein
MCRGKERDRERGAWCYRTCGESREYGCFLLSSRTPYFSLSRVFAHEENGAAGEQNGAAGEQNGAAGEQNGGPARRLTLKRRSGSKINVKTAVRLEN